MKKGCSLICLILVLLSMVLPVGAEETANTEDSVTISEDILSCLDAATVDTIFRAYDINDGFDIFTKYGDMDGVLANTPAERLRIYYFVKNKQGETGCYTYDGSRLIETGYTWGAQWFALYGEKTNNLIQKVDANIVVENIYYFWFGNWYAVYYKTNLGDYVYFNPDETEYLMGLAQFTALGSELKDLVTKYKVLSGMVGCEPVSIIHQLQVDLSPYDITSPDFDPHAPLKTNFKPGKLIAIGSIALLVVLIVGRFLIRGHRKYRASKNKLAYRF